MQRLGEIVSYIDCTQHKHYTKICTIYNKGIGLYFENSYNIGYNSEYLSYLYDRESRAQPLGMYV